jgi:hypothetical protein
MKKRTSDEINTLNAIYKKKIYDRLTDESLIKFYFCYKYSRHAALLECGKIMENLYAKEIRPYLDKNNIFTVDVIEKLLDIIKYRDAHLKLKANIQAFPENSEWNVYACIFYCKIKKSGPLFKKLKFLIELKDVPKPICATAAYILTQYYCCCRRENKIRFYSNIAITHGNDYIHILLALYYIKQEKYLIARNQLCNTITHINTKKSMCYYSGLLNIHLGDFKKGLDFLEYGKNVLASKRCENALFEYTENTNSIIESATNKIKYDVPTQVEC